MSLRIRRHPRLGPALVAACAMALSSYSAAGVLTARGDHAEEDHALEDHSGESLAGIDLDGADLGDSDLSGSGFKNATSSTPS